MAKYSKKAGEKIEKAVHEEKEGTLETGSGKKVTSKNRPSLSGSRKQRRKALKCLKKTEVSAKHGLK